MALETLPPPRRPGVGVPARHPRPRHVPTFPQQQPPPGLGAKRGRRGHGPRRALCHEHPAPPPSWKPPHRAVLGGPEGPSPSRGPPQLPSVVSSGGAASRRPPFLCPAPGPREGRAPDGHGGRERAREWKSRVPWWTRDRGAWVPAVAHPVPVSRGSCPSSRLSQASPMGEGQTHGRGVGAELVQPWL